MSGVLAILGLALTLQSPQQIRPGADSARPARLPPSGRAVATHADKAPVIDGVDDDAVWQKAKVISDFKQWQPTEGKEPRFRTEAKVAYDAGNLYVFVRAFDPQIAVVSVGRTNHFGHPAPEVLQRYEEVGTKIFRTDQDGAVTIDTDGHELDVHTFTGRRLHLPTPVH